MINAALLTLSLALSLTIVGTQQTSFILLLLLIAMSGFTGARRLEFIPLAWAGALILSGFFLAPVVAKSVEVITSIKPYNGNIMIDSKKGYDYVLLLLYFSAFIMPITAMTATKRAIIPCFVVVLVFAIGLIYQHLFAPELMYNGKRAAFPMANPNNAATVINLALVPVTCLFMRYRKPIYLVSLLILLGGLLATHSRGGFGAYLIASGVYMVYLYPKTLKIACGAILAGLIAVISYPKALNSILSRVPIWEASIDLVSLKGSGFGTFHKLYRDVRIEKDTDGFFAHNDLLQFAIELGAPAALLFLGFVIWIALKTNNRNMIPACAMLSVFVHSFISFPFYILPVNIGLGVLLAFWFSNKEFNNEKNVFNCSGFNFGKFASISRRHYGDKRGSRQRC